MVDKREKDLGRKIASTALANFALPISAFLIGPLLARYLGPSGRGDLAAAVSLLTLLSLVAAFGMQEAVIFYVSKARYKPRQVIRLGLAAVVGVGLVAMVCGVLTAGFVANGRSGIEKLIMLTCLAIVPTAAVTVFRGHAAGVDRWDLVNGEKYINALLRVSVFFLLAVLGALTIPLAAAVWALTPILAGAIYFGLYRPRSTNHCVASALNRYEFLSYGGKVWSGSLSGVLLLRLDQVLMSPLAGTTQLGLYATAVNVGDAGLLLNNAIRDVVFSDQSKTGDPSRLASAARKSLLLSTVLGVALGAPIEWWFPIVFGEDFRAAAPAAAVLTGAAVIGVPGSVAGVGLSARGRPGLRSVSLAVACVVNIAFLLLFVPTGGVTGAAWSMVAGVIVASNGNILFMNRYFGSSFWSFYFITRTDCRELTSAIGRLARVKGA